MTTDTADNVNINELANRIDLGLGSDPIPEPATVQEPSPPVEAVVDEDAEVPKSWPKEMHEHWSKIDKPVRSYWRTHEKQMLDGLEQYKSDATYGKSFRDILNPYAPHLKAANIKDSDMVRNLMNANWRLTQGDDAARRQAYQELGQHLGFISKDTENGHVTDPVLKQVLERVSRMEEGLTAQREAALARSSEESAAEVNTFADAKDDKGQSLHPFFDEVAEDITYLIKAGLSLKDAYERAIWANPVVREKQLASVRTEHETQLKENARLASLPKKQAMSATLKTKDTAHAPTEEVGGDLKETARKALEAYRNRT